MTSHQDERGGRTSPGRPPGSASPTATPRRLTARSLKGIAHPLRMRLMEELSVDGPDTATGLAKRVGENTGTVSWHLRQLAEHGFIEEDRERGTRRERWWRKIDEAIEVRGRDFDGDPATEGALKVYVRESLQQDYNRVADSFNTAWERRWTDASTLHGTLTYWMTPEQLTALNREVLAVIERHQPPPETSRDPDARSVVIQYQGVPRAPETAHVADAPGGPAAEADIHPPDHLERESDHLEREQGGAADNRGDETVSMTDRGPRGLR